MKGVHLRGDAACLELEPSWGVSLLGWGLELLHPEREEEISHVEREKM
jgi:hypothetical protein